MFSIYRASNDLYVKHDATDQVFCWKNVNEMNPDDDEYIGDVVGLEECRKMAYRWSRRIGETWNTRSYICMLVKDGRSLEKHRL